MWHGQKQSAESFGLESLRATWRSPEGGAACERTRPETSGGRSSAQKRGVSATSTARNAAKARTRMSETRRRTGRI
jgi:hypothetical protein